VEKTSVEFVQAPNGTSARFSFPPSIVRTLAVLAVLLGLLSVVGREIRVSKEELTRNDFTQDYISAKAWRADGNPYDPIVNLSRRYLGESATPGIGPGQVNPHAPTQIVFMSPLTALPYRAARALWLLMISASLAFGVWLVARGGGIPARTSAVIGIGVLALPVSQTYFQLVQFDGFIVLLLAAAWLSLRRGRDARAGAALGLAAALKFFPAIMILVLLRECRVRAAAWMVCSAIAISAVAVLAMGSSNLHRFLSTASPQNFRFWRGSPLNISLIGIPYRWLTSNTWRPHQPNLPVLAAFIALAIGCLALLAVVRTPAHATRDRFWAAMPWMLLAAPLSWEFSLIYLIPVVLLLGIRIVRDGERAGAATLIALGILVIGIPPGLQVGAVQGGTTVVRTLPYLLPTSALLFVALLEWRRGQDGVDIVTVAPAT
jgi:hypothetical protein